MTAWGMALVLAAFALGLGGALAVRRWAGRFGLVAAVNDRSSHIRPTPTGGGIGMVLGGTLAALPVALADARAAGVALVALGIAALGFADDRAGLSPALRLPLQLLGLGAIVLLALPGLPLWALPIAVLAAGWWLNLYNFMDGIDGLAGSEAVFMLGGGALLWFLGDAAASSGALYWWIAGGAAAAAGFLMLNWPPAKVFMGDVGATWLGATIAGLAALTSALPQAPSLWQWLILGATFTADATATLSVRALRGERLWQAHRSHAYQRLSRHWRSHRTVTLCYVAVDVVWLLPLAIAAGAWPAWAPALAGLAHLPLVVMALSLGAGRPDAVSPEPT